MYAIPTPGRRVPLPGIRQFLPESGQNIGPMTQYWQRRLRDGDITVSTTVPIPIPSVAPASEPAASPTPTAEPTKSTS
ncbi:MAG: DUF2635 domain-containing protein [Ferrovum sp.]|nr:DUF2635 domain-containing protein [Ferrovum sp.]